MEAASFMEREAAEGMPTSCLQREGCNSFGAYDTCANGRSQTFGCNTKDKDYLWFWDICNKMGIGIIAKFTPCITSKRWSNYCFNELLPKCILTVHSYIKLTPTA